MAKKGSETLEIKSKMEPNTTTIASGLQKVRGRIKNIAEKAGRQPEAITLLAASKTNPAECLREAFAAGQTIFGENYLQEAFAAGQTIFGENYLQE